MMIRPSLVVTVVLTVAVIVAFRPANAQPQPAAPKQLADNGNDTITDAQTGLMWEKKTTAVGSGANLRDLRDVDNTYTWEYAMGDWIDQMNGRLITNVGDGGFAGYSDWRVPTLAELNTIFEPMAPGRINAMFGANVPAPYWSASRRALGPSIPWYILFGNDIPLTVGKPFLFHVRAVRGGKR